MERIKQVRNAAAILTIAALAPCLRAQSSQQSANNPQITSYSDLRRAELEEDREPMSTADWSKYVIMPKVEYAGILLASTGIGVGLHFLPKKKDRIRQ